MNSLYTAFLLPHRECSLEFGQQICLDMIVFIQYILYYNYCSSKMFMQELLRIRSVGSGPNQRDFCVPNSQRHDYDLER